MSSDLDKQEVNEAEKVEIKESENNGTSDTSIEDCETQTIPENEDTSCEVNKLKETDSDDTSDTPLDDCETQENAEVNKLNYGDKALCIAADNLSAVAEKITTIEEVSKKTRDEIHQLHKLYHNEYAGRLRKVENELNRYQEIDRGRAFDGILTEIARLYSDNVAVADEISDTRAQKQIRYMFLDLLQMLETNGVLKQESNVGEKRNTRHCQVVERIPTEDPSEHDTVAKSLSIGFYVDNRTLIKERIHLFIKS